MKDLGVLMCRLTRPLCGNWLLKLWDNLLSLRQIYWGVDKSLARPISRCILFDGENISFDSSLVLYI